LLYPGYHAVSIY